MKDVMKMLAFFVVGMVAALLLDPGVVARVQVLLLQIIYF